MELEQNSTKLEQLLNVNDRQIITLQKELLKVKKANQGLNDEKSNLLRQIKDKEKVIGGLEEEKVATLTEQSLVALDCSHYKREVEVYDEFLKSNLAKTDFYVKTISQLDNELKGKINAIKELDRQNILLSTEKSALEDIESTFQKKEEIYKSTINKLFEDMNTVYQTFQTRTVELEHKLDVEVNKNQNLQNNEGNLNQTISNLEQSLEEQNGNTERDIHDLNRAIDLSLIQNKQLTEDIERLTEDLKGKNTILEEREKKTLQTFKEKTQKISSLSQETQDLQAKLIEKDALLTRLHEQNRQIQVRETLLNQGLEQYEAQREELDKLSKEELMERLRQANEALALIKGEKTKLQVQLSDIRKDLAEKVPSLLDKHAQFSKASEENENLRTRLEKVMEEMTSIYRQKVTYEQELKKLKDEANFENFDAAFLSNQVSKLLIQNNKLKLACINGTGGDSIEDILAADTEPENSVFYSDIDDLQKKHRLLVKRVNELKIKKERPAKQGTLQGKRLSRIEEENEEFEESEELGTSQGKDVREIIEKKRKLDPSDFEAQALKEAQEAKIKNLNKDIVELKSKLRKSEQESDNLKIELQVEKNNNTYRLKNQTLNMEMNVGKVEENENEIQRLLEERESLNHRILEKERNLSNLLGKVGKLQKENLDLQKSLNLLQNDLSRQKGFEERLSKTINEAQKVSISGDRDPYQLIRNLQEENLASKIKLENQTVLAKTYKDRCSNFQNLLNDISQEFQTNSQKLHKIFFEDEIKDSYNSSSQEVFHLRGQLYELKEILNFYKQELAVQTGDYQQAFDRIEEITGTITENFAGLENKFTEQETQFKDKIRNIETDQISTIQDLQSRVEQHLEGAAAAAEEEVYEDNDWVHISEYQQLQEKLKKEEENVRALQRAIEEMREQLLHEREANLKQTSVQQQENEQVKKYLTEINTLTNERNDLNDIVAKLREKNEILQQHLADTQEKFDREIALLTQENSNLRADINKLTEDFGRMASENIEQMGIGALGQRNNLLMYLREKNSELVFERDQLKSKLFAHRKMINGQKTEKLQQIEVLENELRDVKKTRNLETVPQTSFLKGIIEENKTLHQENTKNKRILDRQGQQIKVFEQYQREEAEQEAESPVGMEEDDEEALDADKILTLLERAKAQYEVLGKLDMNQPEHT